MPLASQTAVEIHLGPDNLDIWVDANNNGKRDDDDVNIYVTASGGFYTTSPTFKHALDETIQMRIKALAVAMLRKEGDMTRAEEALSELALELVVKAQDLNSEAPPIAYTAPAIPAPTATQEWQEAIQSVPAWQAAAAIAPQPYHEPVLESAPHTFAYDLQPQPAIESTPVPEVKANAIWIDLSKN